ncbi:SRPBCC family protein [Qaidamihabitans albus]|uniref:SRPBCC family protein n=1 Tax=Qaidamihabitans albus TaxID=2795733 RepID=UPI0018F13A33|nr:SRPBCC family protein [Qaidamihabitans albus]
MGGTYSFEVRRTSSAPPRELFRLETDGALWSEWAKPLIVVSGWERRGDPDPGGVGAIRKVGAWPLLMHEQTIEYEADRRHVYTFAGPPAPVRDYRAEVLFTPVAEGGTELCWRGSFTEALPGTGPLARVLLLGAIRFLSARLVRAAERG